MVANGNALNKHSLGGEKMGLRLKLQLNGKSGRLEKSFIEFIMTQTVVTSL
jgi:hypothetical protein